MRRFGVIVALGALLGMLGGLLTAAPALAGRGHKWVFAPETPFTLPKSFCGFKVRVTFPVNKEYSKLLKAPDGSTLVLTTGSLQVTLTNLSTGKAATVNASGPIKFTRHADGSATSAGKGHSLNILSPADAQRFGLPSVALIAGPTTVSFAADGTITSLTMKGHVLEDVCAALS